ncbi:MAG: glycosyltransferase family 4 protein [Candidatus Hermodarchaeota archaeon]
MNILLITDDFYPNSGGVAHTMMNLYNFSRLKRQTIFIFNPNINDKDIYKNLKFLKDYTIKHLINSILRRNFLQFALLSAWKIIKDRKIPFSQKMRIILHFLIKPRKLIWVIENIISVYPYMKRLDFGVIMGGNSYQILDLNFVLSRLLNKKLICMAHGDDFLIPWNIVFKTLFHKSIYFQYADKIILSNEINKYLIKRTHHLDDNKLEVIYRAINIKDLKINQSKFELRKEFNIPEKQFVLLSVGVHRFIKRFDLVIQAVHRIKQKNPELDLRYYLIGEGPETPKLKKLTIDLRLENEVVFLGRCDMEKRNKYYKLSDVFIMPSMSTKSNIEGFGITFIEANYYKVPVIGAHSGGIPAVIKDGINGLLIKQNDVDDLVNKVLFLYKNEDLRKEMGEKGHKQVISQYVWDKIIDDYIKIFESL